MSNYSGNLGPVKSEYTPTTDEVGQCYAYMHYDLLASVESLAAGHARFYRWLAQRDQEAEARGAARERERVVYELARTTPNSLAEVVQLLGTAAKIEDYRTLARDTDHAVALEREAIAAWLEARQGSNRLRNAVLQSSADGIRTGKHNEGTP